MLKEVPTGCLRFLQSWTEMCLSVKVNGEPRKQLCQKKVTASAAKSPKIRHIIIRRTIWNMRTYLHWIRKNPSTRQTRARGGRVQAYIAGAELRQDAAKRPYIYLLVVGKAQNDFRRAVRSRLNIWAEMISLKATASKIDDLHFTSAITLDQYIFGLQVAVNETEAV